MYVFLIIGGDGCIVPTVSSYAMLPHFFEAVKLIVMVGVPYRVATADIADGYRAVADIAIVQALAILSRCLRPALYAAIANGKTRLPLLHTAPGRLSYSKQPNSIL